MKTMTLDEIKKLPPLTNEEIQTVKAFNDTDFSDSPEMTDEQLHRFKPWYEVHPKGNDTFKVSVTKKAVLIRLDSDVLDKLKSQGKGYQTRINQILRDAVLPQ